MTLAKMLAAVALASGLVVGALPCAHAALISGGRYGDVVLTSPSEPMRVFIVLFSARAGWGEADQQAANRLANKGAMVIGVDTERYAATLAATDETCHQLVGDTESPSLATRTAGFRAQGRFPDPRDWLARFASQPGRAACRA